MPEMTLAGPPSQKRRFALFLDGTTDTSQGNTNVWRARSLCVAKGKDGTEQKVYYAVGVGTKLGEIVRGEVFGYGIDDQVVDAYNWLVEDRSRSFGRTTMHARAGSVLEGTATRRPVRHFPVNDLRPAEPATPSASSLTQNPDGFGSAVPSKAGSAAGGGAGGASARGGGIERKSRRRSRASSR